MRPTTFCETVGDVDAEGLVIKIHPSLAKVKAERPGDTLRDVASTDRLAVRLAEVKAKKVGETLTDAKGASLVYTLATTLAGMKAKTVA